MTVLKPTAEGPSLLRQAGIGLLMGLLLAAGFWLRLPMTAYNLPVCATMDERTSLDVLDHIGAHRLDPGFFHYPTFYYYLTHFLLQALPGADPLLAGRMINLLFSCLLALAAFWMTRKTFAHDGAAWLAAAFTLFSPIINLNASYIITDILLALLSCLALQCFALYFQTPSGRVWIWGCLLAGLAASTKYTAGLVTVAYLSWEFLHRSRDRGGNGAEPPGLLSRRWPAWVPGAVAAGLAAVALALSFIPDRLVAALLQGGGPITRLDARDWRLAASLRLAARLLAGGAALFALALARWRPLRERFRLLRPYLGLLLVLLVFLAGSPYIALSFKRFLYDFGAEIKANAMYSPHQQWLTYWGRYRIFESLTVLAFFPVGLYFAWRHRKPVGLWLLYLGLQYLAIGSATRWSDRYLTPLLPVVFMISAWGMAALAGRLRRVHLLLALGLLAGVVLQTGRELMPRLRAQIRMSRSHDEMYEAYRQAIQFRPGRIFFVRFAPDRELRLGGLATEKIPVSWLRRDRRLLLERLKENDWLLLEREFKRSLSPELAAHLEMWWKSEKGVGQYVYRRRDGARAGPAGMADPSAERPAEAVE